MIYQLYQHQSDILDPLRWMARSSSAVFGHPWPGIGTGAVTAPFNEALNGALSRLARSGEEFAVLLLDLDRFKEINDRFGRQAGDEFLVQVAARLQRCTRAAEHVARIGGDEFALIQTGVRGADDAEVMVRRVLQALEQPFTVETQRVHMTASLGVTLFPDDGDTPERLLRNADMALYRAKAAGRRSSAFYRPEMDRELQASRSLQAGLRRALEGEGLRLVYQPVLDVRQRRVVAVEALLLVATTPRIVVRERTLQVGRASIERHHVGQVTGYRGEDARAQRGPLLHGLAFVNVRGWIAPVVRIQLTDERDRTPYWLTSTRRPEELVAALGGTMARQEGTAEGR